MAGLEEALRSPEFVENPYPFYARLRDGDHDGQATTYGYRMYFRHAHISAILRHSGFGQEKPSGAQRGAVLRTNPPEHTRLHALLTAAFTPRSVLALRSRIESLADERVSALKKAGSVDLVADYAHPLPLAVICELLGIPVADRDFIAHASSKVTLRPTPGRVATDAEIAERRDGSRALRGYFRDLIRQRGGRRGNDLVSRLLDANRDGDRMSDSEVLANCMLLLIAGHATTANFIANSALTLMSRPSRLETLAAIPPEDTAWVGEMLRYDAPVQMMSRIATREFDFEGHSFVPGEQVFIVMGSANRDPAAFERPDELDLLRPSRVRHLSLGLGIHFCVGAQLALLEGEVAIRALAPHLPQATFNPKGVRWRRNMIMRGPATLPVALNAQGWTSSSRDA